MGYSLNKARSSLKKKTLPNCHWNKNSKNKKRRKAKLPYDTYDQAMAFIKKNNLENDFVAYKCPYCNKYHVGHRYKEDKDCNDIVV